MSRRRAELEHTADRVFGWKQLRPAQLDAMEAILAGRDVLAVMPTGSGKSAIYQVPAILIDGPTLVISPLIALQQDQIAQLEGFDAPDAVAINSRQGAAQTDRSWNAVLENEAEYIFLAPEQLTEDDVIAQLRTADIALVVVDEVHCVSAWGHDFRPSYLRLADAIERLNRPPVAGLTATASPVVRREIVEHLRLRDPIVIATGFDRPNLRLEVEHFVDDAEQRDAVVAGRGSSTVQGCCTPPPARTPSITPAREGPVVGSLPRRSEVSRTRRGASPLPRRRLRRRGGDIGVRYGSPEFETSRTCASLSTPRYRTHWTATTNRSARAVGTGRRHSPGCSTVPKSCRWRFHHAAPR